MELVIESRLPDGPFSFSFLGFRLKRSIAPGAPRKAYVKYYRLWPLHSALSYLPRREPCVGRSALQKEKRVLSQSCASAQSIAVSLPAAQLSLFLYLTYWRMATGTGAAHLRHYFDPFKRRKKSLTAVDRVHHCSGRQSVFFFLNGGLLQTGRGTDKTDEVMWFTWSEPPRPIHRSHGNVFEHQPFPSCSHSSVTSVLSFQEYQPHMDICTVYCSTTP